MFGPRSGRCRILPAISLPKNSRFPRAADNKFLKVLGQLLGQSLDRNADQRYMPLTCINVVGLVRIELTTSALSVLRSNRLSYSPGGRLRLHHGFAGLHYETSASSGQSRTAND